MIMNSENKDIFHVANSYTYTSPVYTWQWCFNGEWQGITVSVAEPPNWFHRKMQRLILGMHWRKIDD